MAEFKNIAFLDEGLEGHERNVDAFPRAARASRPDTLSIRSSVAQGVFSDMMSGHFVEEENDHDLF